ncbi:MAG: macrolide ABC transporter ATP-binding protein [Lentisphaerae bacterium GWF2_45_14]|nr:MAG: macrolide ABC transporter ATP-binding protein [Lentisphaerae bacterium GWF2_45_14]
MVKFEDIKKSYMIGAQEVPVLKGVSLSVEKGEFVGIMGVSGSGKSTMLNILGLLDVPTGGRYILNGRLVENLSDDELAELRNISIGFIFQSFNLFPHLSVEQNIEVPMVYGEIPSRKRREIAKSLAERVGLGHRLKHKPSELSGGECQRIAIARALGNNPAFLLADEPTGNLDEKTSHEILELFHELHARNQMTLVMVTHNILLEKDFDRVIYLRDGRLSSKDEFRGSGG